MATTLLTSGITMGSSTMSVSGSAPSYTVRTWVNWNAETGTPSIRSSANISSITDNGVGDFTLNLTTAMEDANFAALASTAIALPQSAQQLVRNSDCTAVPLTSSTIRFCTGSSGGSTVNDATWCQVAVVR